MASQGGRYRPQFTARHGLPAPGHLPEPQAGRGHRQGECPRETGWEAAAVSLRHTSQGGWHRRGGRGRGVGGPAPSDPPHLGVQPHVVGPPCLSPSCKDAGQAALHPTLIFTLFNWPAKSLQSCLTLCNPMEPARLLCSWRFSRQEYWSGLPCPPTGESSRSRDRTCVSYVSCTGRRVLYHERHLGSPHFNLIISLKLHLQIQAHSETPLGHMNLAGDGGSSAHDKGAKEDAGIFLLL